MTSKKQDPDLKVYHARHTILYAKGHYAKGNLHNDVKTVIKADGGQVDEILSVYGDVKVSEITLMIRFMAPIVTDAIFSTNFTEAIEDHFQYMQQRGAAMIEKKENINDLVLEEMLSIMAGWCMGEEGYTLGEPDASVLPLYGTPSENHFDRKFFN